MEDIFLHQPAILKHNLPAESLGMPTPPKGDPVFELKTLPDDLKYAFIDEKKIIMYLLALNFQDRKRRDYWKYFGNIEARWDTLWMIL